MSKPLDRMTLLETFVRIADTGSISAAARGLGLSQPSASRQLAELETRLQTQLMRRNTHALALTDAGVDLLADARQLLDSWEALTEKHLAGQQQIQGTLKVVAPIALGQHHLVRIAAAFQTEHPAVALTWELNDQSIRFAQVGCDCWIKVGPVPDETLVVRRLATVERLLVASQPLVAEHGLPGTPKQAASLPLVALGPFEGQRIPLLKGAKRSFTLQPPVRMRTNNIVALKEAALMGVGIAVMPKWFVAQELEEGSLVDLLPGWQAPSLDIHVAYLPGRHQPLRLRAFLDALQTGIAAIAGIKQVQ
ncbi:LysR family transcriptional regulator [Exilibacterium tricleocarpae]|uniref:LysR family transcriptional regulator n=1 Tax=Exilibacterium tricleocarpae TaxID=2591008 RepID=A0A545TLE6_9GAMM|nr:LysR family transcriptional regulator [Exilibacterium tricleocarpae]TQV78028.1 LysR family transcriptional regulator [Exilibacterium tricleocarpae]